MVNYVDYEYYKSDFEGDAIPEESFGRIAKKSSVFVREITRNRVDVENIINDVKDAVCAVCEVMYNDEKILARINGREVKSENTDGYSVTYTSETQDGQTREQTLRKKMYSAARGYLIHTGLLYRG